SIKEIQRELLRIESVAEQYQEANRNLERINEARERLRQAVGEFLGRELAADDDMVSLLRQELNRIEGLAKKIKEAVVRKDEVLRRAESQLERIRLAGDVLRHEEKRDITQAIRQSPAFRGVEEARDRVAEFVADAEAIRSAIADVSA